MKTNETSISECMSCGSHQLTSLGSRCKYPTANGCCNGKMQLYKSTREQALAWWRKYNFTIQWELIVKHKNLIIGYPHRSPITLTGREIEEIWLKERIGCSHKHSRKKVVDKSTDNIIDLLKCDECGTSIDINKPN